jgi:nucleotide-binding universal stress UspA family protein
MIPPRRILAAVDFSPESRAALAFAAALAAKATAELHVLHALDPGLAEAADKLAADLIGRTRRDLEQLTRSDCPPECRRLLHVVVGEAAAVICDIALREQADVVVLGIRGQSPCGSGRCGRTAHTVVRNAMLPTMFVPELWHAPGTRPGAVKLGPVIAAVDSCQPSMLAANAAATLAVWLGTTFELVHVGGQPPLLPTPTPVHLLSGNTAEALAEAAVPRDGACPILVMGRRTHGDGVSRPGSMIAEVIAAARAPVLMYLPTE